MQNAQNSTKIAHFVPVDRLQIDTAPLCHLFKDLGEEAAESVICRALDDLAARVHKIGDNHRACAFHDLRAEARRVVAVAEQIGLTEVATVANHIQNCAKDGSSIALSALVARLTRVSDRANTEIWSERDKPAGKR